MALIRHATHYFTTVQWDCGGRGCGTNDLAGGAPVLGITALVLGAVLLIGTIRTVSAPLAVLAGSTAAFVGWQDAVADRLVTAESVRVWTTIVLATGAIGLVLVLLTGFREIKKSGAFWMLSGRSVTWGRVTNFENIEGDRRHCYGTVHFDDANGSRHSVRTLVPRETLRRPPRVYYKPSNLSDLGTVRIGMPSEPMMGTSREAQLRAVRALLPLPSDIQQSVPPMGRSEVPGGFNSGSPVTFAVSTDSADLADALERLAMLHRSGALSDAEFASAKTAVLKR
jgi:hypothetical protein